MRKVGSMWGGRSSTYGVLVGLVGLAACTADKAAPSRSEAPVASAAEGQRAKSEADAVATSAPQAAEIPADPGAPRSIERGKGKAENADTDKKAGAAGGLKKRDLLAPQAFDGQGYALMPHRAGSFDSPVPQSSTAVSTPNAPPPPPSQGVVAPNPYRELAKPEVAIDPNGRFATTYRPGGGHLAAFDSALARGVIPASEKEIVSDLGARYAPTLDQPKSTSLALRNDLERTKIAPSGGPLHVRIDLQSIDKAPAERPHLSVVVVLDVSGSMRGELISSARQAASDLVDKLAPGDDFSMITFSTGAEVKVPLESVGSHKDAIKKTISEVVEGGGTNISEGLRLGYEQAHDKKIPEDAVRVVMLLSDGRANDGITNPRDLSAMALNAFQDGVQTSTFGLGTDYDGPLMSSIANDGAGGYYYLPSPKAISGALSTEVDKRLDPVATAVEVRVRLKPGIDLLDAYGSRKLGADEAANVRTIEVAQDKQAEKKDHIKANRKDDVDGGMRFFIPAYARNEGHAILLKLKLPEGVGDKEIALVELKYKDRVSKKNVAEEIPIKASYADSDAASAKTIDPSVARTVQGFQAGETLMAAADAIHAGDHAKAVRLLAERVAILQAAAVELDEPLFTTDSIRLSRLTEHAGERQGPMADPLVLAMAMETAGSVHMR